MLERFSYPGPGGEGGRVTRDGGLSYHLCAGPTLRSKVLVLEPGVHNSAHAHADEDAHYFVLHGRVTFYGDGDVPTAELGTNDGLFMPHAAVYWFANTGDEPLQMLRVSTAVAT